MHFVAISSFSNQNVSANNMNGPLVIMGVAGCGKTSLASVLAAEWHWALIEGDDFHPESNVQKMRQGIALSDDDRSGWLDTLSAELEKAGSQAVLTCSALKKSYRDRLRAAHPKLRFVHLQLTQAKARERVQQRESHYFSASLVESQFNALESTQDESGVLNLPADQEMDVLMQSVLSWMSSQNVFDRSKPNKFEQLSHVLIGTCLGVMAVSVFTNVVLRYGFGQGIAASEELSRLLFVWMVFIGATAAYPTGEHMAFNALVVKLSKKPVALGVLTRLIRALVVLCCVLLGMGAWQQVLVGMESVSVVLGYPMALLPLPVLLSASLIGAMALVQLLNGSPIDVLHSAELE